VIRTKGNKAQRTSGFMSRWIGYAELYFSDQLYPDFSIQDLKQALDRYSSVVNDRNFGK
jgi:undecaprenyl diphosphate synthase